jgi:hypothetical protein
MDDVVVVVLRFEDGTSTILGVCSGMNFAFEFAEKFKKETSSKREFKTEFNLCKVHQPESERG